MVSVCGGGHGDNFFVLCLSIIVNQCFSPNPTIFFPGQALRDTKYKLCPQSPHFFILHSNISPAEINIFLMFLHLPLTRCLAPKRSATIFSVSHPIGSASEDSLDCAHKWLWSVCNQQFLQTEKVRLFFLPKKIIVEFGHTKSSFFAEWFE